MVTSRCAWASASRQVRCGPYNDANVPGRRRSITFSNTWTFSPLAKHEKCAVISVYRPMLAVHLITLWPWPLSCWPHGHAEDLPRIISALTSMLIAQAVLLLKHGQTDVQLITSLMPRMQPARVTIQGDKTALHQLTLHCMYTNNTTQSNLRTGCIATPCGRKWTCPLHVLAVQCPLSWVQSLSRGYATSTPQCHILPIHHTAPSHPPPKVSASSHGHGFLDPLDQSSVTASQLSWPFFHNIRLLPMDQQIDEQTDRQNDVKKGRLCFRASNVA